MLFSVASFAFQLVLAHSRAAPVQFRIILICEGIGRHSSQYEFLSNVVCRIGGNVPPSLIRNGKGAQLGVRDSYWIQRNLHTAVVFGSGCWACDVLLCGIRWTLALLGGEPPPEPEVLPNQTLNLACTAAVMHTFLLKSA